VVEQPAACAQAAKKTLARAKSVLDVPILMADEWWGRGLLDRRWSEAKCRKGYTSYVHCWLSLHDRPTDAGAVSHLPHSRLQLLQPQSMTMAVLESQSLILDVDQTRPRREHCPVCRLRGEAAKAIVTRGHAPYLTIGWSLGHKGTIRRDNFVYSAVVLVRPLGSPSICTHLSLPD
jgi:hypothetical protein